MKSAYNGVAVPGEGKAIGYGGGVLQVPDNRSFRLLREMGREEIFGRRRGGCLMRRWRRRMAGSGAWRGLKCCGREGVQTFSNGCGRHGGKRRGFSREHQGPLTTPVGGEYVR